MLKIKPEKPMPSRVLLTRPQQNNKALSQLLTEHGIDSVCCPLITVHQIVDDGLTDKLVHCDVVIAVSANAVRSASLQVKGWPKCQYIAVGKATQAEFQRHGIDAMAPEDHRTEGMLLLPHLAHPKGKKIVILRGNGGRETLAQQLQSKGGLVTYSELYRREQLSFPKNIVAQWQQQSITTIVVTSAEILQKLIALVNDGYQSWLAQVVIVVPSERVAEVAKQLGVVHIEIANGADNLAILNKLKNLQSSFYEK